MALHRMIKLEHLPRPVYFICKNVEYWKELYSDDANVSMEALHERFRDARDSWSVQPYIQLKERGLDVRLSPNLVPGEICIVTYDELRISDKPYNSFVVCCRHDRGIPMICNLRIVQNELNVLTPNDYFIPHWPQPFIIPRDPERGTLIENIGYKGRLANLAGPFRAPEFREKLTQLGVHLHVSPEEDADRVKDSKDYHDVDLVLAVRDSTEYNLSIKPPSKLINSWLAGCPAILGPEPAYQQLRRHPLDYFEIRSVDEAIEYIRILKNNPTLFKETQDQCDLRAKEFNPDAIAKIWRDLLAGPIMSKFVEWQKQDGFTKNVIRPAEFAIHSIQHRMERKVFMKNIKEGKRYF